MRVLHEEYDFRRTAGPVTVSRWFVPADDPDEPELDPSMSISRLNIGGLSGLDVQLDATAGRPAALHLWLGDRGVHIWFRGGFSIERGVPAPRAEDHDA